MNDTYTDFLRVITGFGDALVLATLVIAFSAYLIFLDYKREALSVILGFVLPAIIIGCLKIGFYTCQTNLWGIVSPSGHAALSIGVYGLVSLILAKLSKGIWRALFPLTLMVLMFSIAISRILLEVHTEGDVILGSIIGLLVVYGVAKVVLSYRLNAKDDKLDNEHKKNIQPIGIAVFLMVVVFLAYGTRVPSERVFFMIAKEIRSNSSICDI